MAELAARLQNLVRRSGLQPRTYVDGELEIDVAAKRLAYAGKAVNVSAKEWALLTCLAENAGGAVSREQLSSAIWGAQGTGSEKRLDVLVMRLRKTLQQAMGPRPSPIATEPDGYRFVRWCAPITDAQANDLTVTV